MQTMIGVFSHGNNAFFHIWPRIATEKHSIKILLGYKISSVVLVLVVPLVKISHSTTLFIRPNLALLSTRLISKFVKKLILVKD